MKSNGSTNNGNGRYYGLGIDTGGTYTDGAILDMESGKVLCSAKSLTTRHDLAIGIGNVIKKLDNSLFPCIRLIGISSTLATNSVVEGKGCRVGLIVIGHEPAANIPVDELVQLDGGHNLQGERRAELDIEGAKRFVESVKNKVDAFAISSYLSVRNPEHEIAVRDLIKETTGLPVVCGHELSTALGFNERTITAILNARLIPIITDLIASLKRVQAEVGIKAPLMIVKGDGSLMDESVAKERPVETILSGPAASIIGSKALTGLDDAVIVDVGGTTTDIGILRGGRPRLDPEGATLGNWRTRVKAVDVFTSGIGGDSRLVVAGRKLQLSSLRVIRCASRRPPGHASSRNWKRPVAPRANGCRHTWTLIRFRSRRSSTRSTRSSTESLSLQNKRRSWNCWLKSRVPYMNWRNCSRFIRYP